MFFFSFLSLLALLLCFSVFSPCTLNDNNPFRPSLPSHVLIFGSLCSSFYTSSQVWYSCFFFFSAHIGMWIIVAAEMFQRS
ncbi:hypothetical protein BKA83DRAFT_4197533 [Pisolithus microcarpus]|nr:hypothetical protein BKA83DRAFT_4197533 [Pisolithus microcarpus]